MKMVTGGLFLVSIIIASNTQAQSSQKWGRQVKNPNEIILAHEARFHSDFFRLCGHIDPDVLDFHEGRSHG